jgi:Na+/proline symporter
MTTVQIVLTVIILIYFVVIIYIGKVASKGVKSHTDFHLAGRQLSWFVVAAGLVGTNFSGAVITTATSMSYTYGLGGISYHICAAISFGIMAFIYARRARNSGAFTIAELFEVKYNYTARIIAGFFLTLGAISAAAAQFAAISMIAQTMWGVPPMVGIIATWVVLLLYMYLGGFSATNLTNVPQLLFCILAVPGLAIWVVAHFGGFSAMAATVQPPAALGAKYFTFTSVPLAITLTYILQWMWINGWNSQHYFQRAAAARTNRHGKIGFLFTTLVLFLVVTVPGVILGMYARLADPTLKSSEQALSLLIGLAPAGLGILATLGIFSAAMSTVDACAMGGVTIIVRDIYQRSINPNATTERATTISRIVTFAIMVIVLLAATSLKSALQGLNFIFVFSTSIFGALVAALFWEKASKEGAVISIVVAGVVSVIWTAMGKAARFQGAWWSLVLSMTLMVGISLIVHKTGPWWGKDKKVKPVAGLEDKILEFLSNRKATMANLVDYMGLRIGELQVAVNSLQSQGKIKCIDYMTYGLTENYKDTPIYTKDTGVGRDAAMIIATIISIIAFCVMWNITA